MSIFLVGSIFVLLCSVVLIDRCEEKFLREIDIISGAVYIYSMKNLKHFSRSPDAEWFEKPEIDPSIDKWINYWKHNRWVIVPSHRKPGVRTQICFVKAWEYIEIDGIEIDLFVTPRKLPSFGVRFGDLPEGVENVDFPLLVFDDLQAQSGGWHFGQVNQ